MDKANEYKDKNAFISKQLFDLAMTEAKYASTLLSIIRWIIDNNSDLFKHTFASWSWWFHKVQNDVYIMFKWDRKQILISDTLTNLYHSLLFPKTSPAINATAFHESSTILIQQALEYVYN